MAAGSGRRLVSLPWLTAAQSRSGPATRSVLDTYIDAHQGALVTELVDLLSIPNLGSDSENIERNAAHVRAMLDRHGFRAEVLRTRGNPLRLRRPAGARGDADHPALRPLRWPAGRRRPVEAAQSVHPNPPRRPAGRGRQGDPAAADRDPVRSEVAALRPVGGRQQGAAGGAVRRDRCAEGQPASGSPPTCACSSTASSSRGRPAS